MAKPPGLSAYEGWRALESDEPMSSDDRLVGIGSIYSPDTGGYRIGDFTQLIGRSWDKADVNKSYYPYRKGQEKRIKRYQPVALPLP